jgi:hypothetical protein
VFEGDRLCTQGLGRSPNGVGGAATTGRAATTGLGRQPCEKPRWHMRVLCRNLPPILRVCVAPVEDAHADGTTDSPPDSPNKDSRRWPQLVSPRHRRTEEHTPLAGADAEVERGNSRPSDEEGDDDDDDDDDLGQTRFRGRDREARAAHDEAVQQVACVLPFEEEAEVRAVREEEASFLAALGITEGGEEGEEGEQAGEEEGEEALEAEEAAIFAQLLHGSSDAPLPRSANGLPKARLQSATRRPCASCAADVPAGMPAPSCPLLLSAAQRQRRQLSPAKVAAVGAVETDTDSDEENATAVAVEAQADAAVAAAGRATRTVSQRWARTGTDSV